MCHSSRRVVESSRGGNRIFLFELRAGKPELLERCSQTKFSISADRSFSVQTRSNEMTLPEIYVVSRIPNLAAHLREALKGRGEVVEIVAKFTVQDGSPKIKPEVVERLQNVEVLVTDTHILKDVLYDLPKMKLVQLTSAGVENLLPGINRSRPFPQYSIVRAGCFGVLMAEYVVAGIINFERGLYRYFKLQENKEWDSVISLDFRTLSDLRIGILGAGVIGEEIARSLSQFGACVSAFARRSRSREEVQRSSFQDIIVNLASLLEDCHYLVNALPSTPSTVGLLNGDVLKQCKNSPVFINVGRGSIISESCLLHALEQKWISGAILDVFEVEPLPKSSLLWTTPNVIITPHMSGPSRPHEVTRGFVQNYDNYLEGKPLLHKFSFASGY